MEILKSIKKIMPLWAFLCVVFGFAGLMYAVKSSDLSKLYNYYFQHRVEFLVRAWLGKEPNIDPKIKVLLYDDISASFHGAPQLSGSDWESLLKAISKRKPKTILIDKIFGFENTETGGTSLYSAKTEAALKESKAVVAAFWSPSEIPGKSKLFDFWQGKSDFGFNTDIHKGEFYGSHPTFLKSLHKVGGVNSPDYGYLPLLKTDAKGRQLPHISLHTADSLAMSGDSVVVNGLNVTKNSDDVVVNLLSLKHSADRLISLKNFIRYARLEKDLDPIEEGDTVLVLPEQLTGTSEYTTSYFGAMPAGLFVVSMVNSVITGNWLKEHELGNLLILVFSISGGILGIMLSGGSLSFVLAFLSLSVAALGIFTFITDSTFIPWFESSISLFFAGGSAFFIKTSQKEKESAKIKNALNNMIPREKLDAVIEYQMKHPFKPGICEMTVVFVDIAGFSFAVAKMSTEQAFNRLAELMRLISDSVQSHGGVVDKNLGDGMLCYFGYDFGGSSKVDTHADDAVKFAIEIQRKIVTDILTDREQGLNNPILPLRVGINTGEVFIGDLGSGNRIEFTIIGDAVNFAQRLESSAEDFYIMIGESTNSALSVDVKQSHPTLKRLIKIKHHTNLFPAFQIDPYENTSIDAELAKNQFAEFAGKLDREDRINLAKGAVKIESEHGSGFIKNVSKSGICVVLDTFLAKDVTLNFRIFDDRGTLKWALEDLQLSPAQLQVRWGKKVEEGYEHGLKLQFVNDEQNRKFVTSFHSFIHK